MRARRSIALALAVLAPIGGGAILVFDGGDDPCVLADEEIQRSPYFRYQRAVDHVRQQTAPGQCTFGVEIGRCDDKPWRYIAYNTGYVGGRYYYAADTDELLVMVSFTDAVDEQCQGHHFWPQRTQDSICVHDGNRVEYRCYDATMARQSDGTNDVVQEGAGD